MPKYYEAYDKRYRQVHRQNLQWASDNPSPIVLQTIQKLYKGEHPRILEIGCGEGRDCLFLLRQGYDVDAVDISEEAVRTCRQKATEADHERFAVLDVCTGRLEKMYDFIYSVSTLHMLVLDEDRRNYFAFIKNHLLADGFALILTMGDGEEEFSSDIASAFENRARTHQETGATLEIASTSCRVVCFATFEKELTGAGFIVQEKGVACIEPDFPTIMYALVRHTP